MKKLLLMFALAAFMFACGSTEEKSSDDVIEVDTSAIEEEVEDAVEDVEDAVEDAADEIEEEVDGE